MRKRLFVQLIFIFIFRFTTEAKETDSLFRKNSIYINVGQLCFWEINIEHERFLFKNLPLISINGAFGYKFEQGKESFQNLASPNYWADLLGYFWSQSFYGTISCRKYLLSYDRKETYEYLEFAPFYRNNNFRKKMIHYDEGQDERFTSIDKLQSSIEHVIGIKFLYGMKIYPNTGKKKFTYGFHFGLGLRTKYIHKITYGDSVSGALLPSHEYISYNSPIIENYWAPAYPNSSTYFPFSPSLHLGIKFGFELKNK